MSKKMTPERARCPNCGQPIKDDWREITLSKSLGSALFHVYKWATLKEKDEFEMADVKHLLSQTQYATFNDIPKITPSLLSRDRETRRYMIDRERCRRFFKGEIAVPIAVWKHGITGEIKDERIGHVSELKGIYELMDQDGDFMARYVRVPAAEGSDTLSLL